MFKTLDLFSGIGGFSLGLEATGGFKTAAFCEIEEYPQRVLNKHWPDVPIYNDTRLLTASKLKDDGIYPDVITGGFPCQDISYAGKGAGIDGERSGLWSEIVRLAGEIRPRYIIVENVPALLGRGLSRVLGDLAAIGYDAEWYCIPASAIGAPHRRDRIWIIAHPASERQSKACKFRYEQFEKWITCCREENNAAYPRSERKQGGLKEKIHRLPTFSWCKDIGSLKELRARPDLPPPLFRGSHDGIPDWSHRLKVLGNAIVPQIATIIGEVIIESERLDAANDPRKND